MGLLERAAGFRGDEQCQVKRQTIKAAVEGKQQALDGDLIWRVFMEVKGSQRDRSSVRG